MDSRPITVFSDPFYRKGPNDQGVGWNVLSVARAAWPWALAWPLLVGIPAGLRAIGRF